MKTKPRHTTGPRYLFQCNTDVPVARKLSNKYPDSVVTDKNPTITPEQFSAVICLSKNISHSSYNGMRTQCKVKGIPFIHVCKTNLTYIESQLPS